MGGGVDTKVHQNRPGSSGVSRFNAKICVGGKNKGPNEVVLVIYRTVTQQSDGRRGDRTARAQGMEKGGTWVRGGDACGAAGGQKVAP